MTNKIEDIRQLQEKPKWAEEYIPLDKSWIIRMGVLDLLFGDENRKAYLKTFLGNQKDLGGDLLALKGVSETWDTNEPVDVGESATLYRILQFASRKFNLNKEFVTRGTLTERVRNMTEGSEIVEMSLNELLNLPKKTSQWATASVLCGNTERISNPPHHLQVSFEAVDYWNKQKEQGKIWEARPDETIRKQAEVFLELMRRKDVSFAPLQAEDYCFAYTFGYMTREEGEMKWPELPGHESNRFIEMENMLWKAKAGEMIDSKDHRVVQALVMWGLVNNKDVKILNRDAVNKTWPKFWDFINYAKSLGESQ
ncbi:MAG: hypothetical protein HW400_471 [Candidatus Levybacteria bacterium]|nr:hypothetical protein [Candidatus Levybacteria bacterium]